MSWSSFGLCERLLLAGLFDSKREMTWRSTLLERRDLLDLSQMRQDRLCPTGMHGKVRGGCPCVQPGGKPGLPTGTKPGQRFGSPV